MDHYTNAITATQPSPKWSNTTVALFHFLNQNGLYQKKKAINELISKAVDEGKCKGGALFAYGEFNNYSTEQLVKLVNKRRVSSFKLRIALEGIEDDLRRAEAFLATIE